MEKFASQDPRSYSLYFDLNIWFRARKVIGTFEKRAPGLDFFTGDTFQVWALTTSAGTYSLERFLKKTPSTEKHKDESKNVIYGVITLPWRLWL